MAQQPPEGPATPPPPPRRELRRSRSDRVIGGVAGGIAEYFTLDPVLVRIAWVLLAIIGGGGIVAYLIAWIVIPEAGGDTAIVHRADGDAIRWIIGVTLIAIGVVALSASFAFAFIRFMIPVIVIALGALILFGSKR